MDDVRLVQVGDFPNRIEAQLALGALESEGIDAMVSADDAGGMRPSLWLSGVRLLVREPDAARALELLNLRNP